MTTHLPALVTLLNLLLLGWTIWLVGRARTRHGIRAPATTGNVDFERVFRVQMNTIEATVLFLPALWVAARYWNPTWAGILGVFWLLARTYYVFVYTAGGRRGFGFIPAAVINVVLVVAGFIGVIAAMMRGG